MHINPTLRKVIVQDLKVQNESYLEELIHNIKEFSSSLQDSLVHCNPIIYPPNIRFSLKSWGHRKKITEVIMTSKMDKALTTQTKSEDACLFDKRIIINENEVDGAPF